MSIKKQSDITALNENIYTQKTFLFTHFLRYEQKKKISKKTRFCAVIELFHLKKDFHDDEGMIGWQKIKQKCNVLINTERKILLVGLC